MSETSEREETRAEALPRTPPSDRVLGFKRRLWRREEPLPPDLTPASSCREQIASAESRPIADPCPSCADTGPPIGALDDGLPRPGSSADLPCSASETPFARTLGELALVAARTTRAEFAAVHKPFLIQMTELGAAASVGATATPEVQTVLARARAGRGTSALGVHAYELKKRSGANAFSTMITLGRAANNDIVVPHRSVSKFHASFAEGKDGWTITDASMNGTWLECQRLESRRAYALGVVSSLNFAGTVVMVMLAPEAAYDYLGKVRLVARAE